MRLARWRLVGGVAEAQQALARVPARERERTLSRARLSAPPRAAASASARALARILVLVPVLVLARTRVCVLRVDARASALEKIAVGGSEGVRGEREGREGQIAQPRLSVSHRRCVWVWLKICGARTRGRCRGGGGGGGRGGGRGGLGLCCAAQDEEAREDRAVRDVEHAGAAVPRCAHAARW